MSFDELVELSANMKKQGQVPDDAEHSIEIFEVLNQTASVKLTAFWGIDYMHLAKYDGEWKIVQVLWQSHPDKGTAMQATGNFEVQLKPLEVYNQSPDAKIGRLSIDKTLEGDLEATSQGEMLSGGSPAEGSAGYVAIERVTGTLHGKSGSFLLQHTATMTPEAQEATITVVPGSGTGELEGIAGSMGIEIEAGQHSYSFEYTLPAE